MAYMISEARFLFFFIFKYKDGNVKHALLLPATVLFCQGFTEDWEAELGEKMLAPVCLCRSFLVVVGDGFTDILV